MRPGSENPDCGAICPCRSPAFRFEPVERRHAIYSENVRRGREIQERIRAQWAEDESNGYYPPERVAWFANLKGNASAGRTTSVGINPFA